VPSFAASCAFGVPSPFDQPKWLSLDYGSRSTLPSDTQAIRSFAQQLSIRLPRLVAIMRRIRNDGVDQGDLDAASRLGADLMKLVDSEAESSVLHRVAARRTKHPEDIVAAPYSLHFSSSTDYDACIYYWQLRLVVLRLHDLVNNAHANIDANGPSAAYAASNSSFPSSKTVPLPACVADVRTEAQRLAKNIIMSWEDCYDRGQFGRSRMSLALPIAWGAIFQFGNFTSLQPSEIHDWLAKRFEWIFPPAQGSGDGQELDILAELLVGGPLHGTFVQIYRAQWRSIMVSE
jgi:hypothetical protein